jgi:hypothetical protein
VPDETRAIGTANPPSDGNQVIDRDGVFGAIENVVRDLLLPLERHHILVLADERKHAGFAAGESAGIVLGSPGQLLGKDESADQRQACALAGERRGAICGIADKCDSSA